MRGKLPRVNPLELRKELLIAESEINRAHAISELTVIKSEVVVLMGRAQTLIKGVSTAAVLVAGLSVFLRRKAVEPQVKRSLWQTLFKGAGLILSVWPVFRKQGGVHKV